MYKNKIILLPIKYNDLSLIIFRIIYKIANYLCMLTFST